MGYGDASLIAIDPGNKTGIAIFRNQKLLGADVEEGDLARGILHGHNFGGCLVVIEFPRWYPHTHKVDWNDLIDLAGVAGRLRGYYERQNAKVEYVRPRTWKGTVRKDVHNKRVLAALTDEERALLPKRPRTKDYDHNLVDAVGIGLWKLGRM